MSFRCDTCDAPAFAVAPGSEEVRNLFLLLAEKPLRCWCFDCWRARFAAVAEPQP